MSHRNEIVGSLEKFRKDYPDPKRVGFLMMKFEDSKTHRRIVEIVKEAFKENGITILRADDQEYHSDLFLNIETYLHGCGLGVAIFDGITTNEFNPNVSLEVGYMMAMHKPILHLKDQKLTSLQTDLTGKLYKNFDTYDLEKTLPSSINKWLKDNKLCYSCFECFVTVNKPMTELVNNQDQLESIIKSISNFAITEEPIVKNLQTTSSGKETTIIFEGPVEFFDVINGLHKKNNLSLKDQVEVVDVSTFSRNIDYQPFDTFVSEGNLTCQICRLEGISGSEHLKQEAINHLPNDVTSDISKAMVYITMDGDLTYFHSNIVNHDHLYPTKLLSNSDKFSLIDAIKFICGYDLLVKPSEDEIIVNHIKNVNYIVNGNIKDKIKFDFAGARHVKFI